MNINMNVVNKILKKSLMTIAVFLSVGCKLTDWASNTGTKARNKIGIESKDCKQFKTDSQADGENLVTSATSSYKFNLYWLGPVSKLNFWEDKMLNENITFTFQPLVLHVLDDRNAELKAVNCTENKLNATACIERLDSIIKMIKDAKASAKSRKAAVSEGKNFTFKCAQKFSEDKISELKRI